MAETEVIRIPKSWKGPIMALRDAVGEEAGAAALMALVETAGATTPEPPQAPPQGTPPPEAPPMLLGKSVPYGISGLLGKLLDMAQREPSRVREILIKAAPWL